MHAIGCSSVTVLAKAACQRGHCSVPVPIHCDYIVQQCAYAFKVNKPHIYTISENAYILLLCM